MAMPRAPGSLRFLGLLLKQPESGRPDEPAPPLELDERDVVWPSGGGGGAQDGWPAPPPPVPEPQPDAPPPPPRARRPRAHTVPQSFGLSSLLADGERRAGVAVAVPVRAVAPGADAAAPRQSAPVRVPVWPGKAAAARRGAEDGRGGGRKQAADESDDDDDEEGEGEMVPPHVVAARRHARSSSMLEGAGRTLKGRDLRRVRNAVLRQTGFLDL